MDFICSSFFSVYEVDDFLGSCGNIPVYIFILCVCVTLSLRAELSRDRL